MDFHGDSSISIDGMMLRTGETLTMTRLSTRISLLCRWKLHKIHILLLQTFSDHGLFHQLQLDTDF